MTLPPVELLASNHAENQRGCLEYLLLNLFENVLSGCPLALLWNNFGSNFLACDYVGGKVYSSKAAFAQLLPEFVSGVKSFWPT